MMNKLPNARGAWLLAPLALMVIAPLGCELIATADRDRIGTGGAGGSATTNGGMGGVNNEGGGGSTGETGGGGTLYAQSQFAEPPGNQGSQFEYQLEEVKFTFIDDAERTVVGIDFTWMDAETLATPVDLNVALNGVKTPLAQVFSVEREPFVRAQWQVQPLRADVLYRVEVIRTELEAWMEIIDVEEDAVLLSGPVQEIDASVGLLTISIPKDHPRVALGDIKTWTEAAPKEDVESQDPAPAQAPSE